MDIGTFNLLRKKGFLVDNSHKKYTGDIKILCQKCSHTRKKKDDTCLSINLDSTLFACHNCGWKGLVDKSRVHTKPFLFEKEKDYVLPDFNPSNFILTDDVIEWFKKRGISERILERNRIVSTSHLFTNTVGPEDAIAFPHYKNHEVVNVHFRNMVDIDKRYRLWKKARVCFYGIDNLVEEEMVATDCVYIVEGHIDALSLQEAGINCVLSVPNGAPDPKTQNPKFEYMDDPDIQKIFESINKVVFAGDDDSPGRKLVEDLATRIGIERCWRVRWPEGCKDANDVLVKYGADKLFEVLSNPIQFPIAGTVNLIQVRDRILNLYENGVSPGLSTGFERLDEIYRPKLGYVTTITGVPSAGKSRFTNQLVVNLAKLHGIHTTLFAPESLPVEYHATKLISAYAEKPFGLPGDVNRISQEEIEVAVKWIDKHFSWIVPETRTLDEILRLTKIQMLKFGTKFLVIDPFNYIYRASGVNEMDHINDVLTKLIDFTRQNEVHIIVVAHPRKMGIQMRGPMQGEYPIVTPYDISGCYDDRTEYLSKTGWKLHKDWIKDEEVLAFDTKTDSLVWQTPSNMIDAEYKGEMHSYQGQSTDICVTPNHRMLVKPYFKSSNMNWQFIESQHLSKSPYYSPRVAKMSSDNSDRKFMDLDNGYNMDSFLKYLGWYISEGWHTSGSVAICQAQGKLSEEMKKCTRLLKLNCNESEYQSKRVHEKPMYRSRVYKKSNPEFCNWILENCGIGCENKKLPSMVWDLSLRQKKILLNALLDGDGSRNKTGSSSYFTSSEKLANEVQRLAIEIGLSATLSKYNSRHINWKDQYVIFIGRPSRSTVSLHKLKRSKGYYEGKVYCFTVPSGAYLTRRNGKVAIQGNSAAWFNRNDFMLSLWRSIINKRLPVRLYTQKVKIEESGQSNEMALFSYNPDTSVYETFLGDPDEDTGVDQSEGADNVEFKAKATARRNKQRGN